MTSMIDRFSEARVVEALARQVGERLTRKVIAELQRMKSDLLSGDDSGLQSTWEEICVQVQGEQSFSWDDFPDMVSTLIERSVQELPSYKREALWLQSVEGIDWSYEDEDRRDPDPVVDKDIIRYLLHDYVFSAAEMWTNARIRAYLHE